MEKNVWISQDEGKSWAMAEGVPQGKAVMVIEHPFDSTMVSDDSGMTVAPVLSFTRPLF